MKREIEVQATPEEVAKMIWAMGSDEQAEMLGHLLKEAGSEHWLMLQFLATRDECEKRDDDSLAAFQCMFSTAFKYFS